MRKIRSVSYSKSHKTRRVSVFITSEGSPLMTISEYSEQGYFRGCKPTMEDILDISEDEKNRYNSYVKSEKDKKNNEVKRISNMEKDKEIKNNDKKESYLSQIILGKPLKDYDNVIFIKNEDDVLRFIHTNNIWELSSPEYVGGYVGLKKNQKILKDTKTIVFDDDYKSDEDGNHYYLMQDNALLLRFSVYLSYNKFDNRFSINTF